MNIFKTLLTTFFFAATLVAQPPSDPRNFVHTALSGTLTDETQPDNHYHDKQGRIVTLEWERFDGDTIPYFNRMKEFAPIESACFLEQESGIWLPLLKQLEENPSFLTELSAKDKSVDPSDNDLIRMKKCLDSGKNFEQALMESFIFDIDKNIAKVIKTGPGNSINFIVVAKATDNTVLGFAKFIIEPEYHSGDIELDILGVIPAAQGRGLSKFLARSILKICPEITRIFLGTFKTNTKAQTAYKAMGFVECHDEREAEFPKSMFFEYKVPASH